MKTAYYVENAFWHSPGTEELKRSFVHEAARQGIQLVTRTNAQFQRENLLKDGPRTALFWDKDLRLAQLMEQEGIVLYNSADAIRLCDDKTLTYLALRQSGLPIPQTLLCPTTFPNVGYPETAFLEEVAEQLGLPFILKEGCGSFGQQVYLVQDLDQAERLVRQAAGAPLLFQRFVAESAGRDLRLYVVGGRVVAAMMRRNDAGDFRANIQIGGHALAYHPTREEAQLAVDACRQLGLHFGGVDLLLSKDGPLVCEVNSNAHFRALRELSGVDPAAAIISLMKEGMA